MTKKAKAKAKAPPLLISEQWLRNARACARACTHFRNLVSTGEISLTVALVRQWDEQYEYETYADRSAALMHLLLLPVKNTWLIPTNISICCPRVRAFVEHVGANSLSAALRIMDKAPPSRKVKAINQLAHGWGPPANTPIVVLRDGHDGRDGCVGSIQALPEDDEARLDGHKYRWSDFASWGWQGNARTLKDARDCIKDRHQQAPF